MSETFTGMVSEAFATIEASGNVDRFEDMVIINVLRVIADDIEYAAVRDAIHEVLEEQYNRINNDESFEEIKKEQEENLARFIAMCGESDD